jgi:hypothetical protein
MRESPNSIPPPPAAAPLPDTGTGKYESSSSNLRRPHCLMPAVAMPI